jgi:hypothetical protein
MKKSFLIAALIVLTASISAFARAGDNDPRAEQAFKKHFAGASNVVWSKLAGGYLQATFTWADHRTIAFFDPSAELVGSVRNLLFNQLPLSIMKTIDREFEDNIIVEIKEITNDDGTFYSIILEQGAKKFNVKVSGAGEILSSEKIKK